MTAVFAIRAPVFAFVFALVESARRAVRVLNVVRSHRAQSVIRGIAITLPVVIIFALLLSAADPIFAAWRDVVDRILSSWSFLPRTIFFFGLLAIVLGAYGFALAASPSPATDSREPLAARQWLGSTERLFLLGGTAALFWIFLAVQLSYLFGNLPSIDGSGMTFAEYARKGFGELTVVASASIALILFGERFGKRDERRGMLRIVTLAVIVAVVLLLASAFKRVLLYEEAYGFTTARLYAQSYMVLVAFALGALGLEVRESLIPSRFFRRTLGAALVLFISLIYWNHESWIAGRNVDRFASTGKLDTVYLTRDLSPNALPALVSGLRTLPEPARTELHRAIVSRYSDPRRSEKRTWFEWNLRAAQARDALLTAGVKLGDDSQLTPR